ncbi:MAG: 50S ribosomal protein L1 [Bdellovibrionales bacterium]|nr:50S ribosomal protein L1 [Bdellovibrionales bacterium]
MAKKKKEGAAASPKDQVTRLHGKKYAASFAQVNRDKSYTLNEAFDLIIKLANAKFDETIDAAFVLGIDTKQGDQQVRGATGLPHGTGKTLRIAVVAKGDKAKEAEAAGADVVGAEDLIERIQGGFLDFDKLIATPDMMVAISKVGKILGPRDLMPNPKLGTVTVNVGQAINEQRKGKVEYRAEKAGIVHVKFGKKSFGSQKLKENFLAVAGAVIRAKPQTSKGTYLKNVTIASTMSPGIRLDIADMTATIGGGEGK